MNETAIIEPENVISDELQLRKLSTEVRSRIKTDITEDFVLAKLTEQDIIGIRDLTHDAYMAKSIILRKLKEKVPYWSKQTKTWHYRDLNNEEKHTILRAADNIFDVYMNKLYMTAILKRNLDKNVLLRLINKAQEAEEEAQMKQTEEGMLKKLLKREDK